jgi:predicted RecA/RadA family phage recombinase
MAYTGQPVPSSVHNIGYGKISDGKSVKVTVPESTKVEAGKFYLLDGFLGCAVQSVETGAGETAEVVLSIEPAEYETDQTKTNDRASMTVGEDIYWDKNNKYFTLSATDIYAGKITSAADSNGVIWFKLAERPFSLDDVTTLAAQVGTLGRPYNHGQKFHCRCN